MDRGQAAGSGFRGVRDQQIKYTEDTGDQQSAHLAENPAAASGVRAVPAKDEQEGPARSRHARRHLHTFQAHSLQVYSLRRSANALPASGTRAHLSLGGLLLRRGACKSSQSSERAPARSCRATRDRPSRVACFFKQLLSDSFNLLCTPALLPLCTPALTPPPSHRINAPRKYNDIIQIKTETCNLNVPIIAYPVMDRERPRNIFPELIDFEKVEVGKTEQLV